jgi:hypothetical protein
MESGVRHEMSLRRKAVWGSGIRLGLVALLAAASSSCGDVVRQGEGSSYLIVDSLLAAPGAEPDDMGGNLLSDVITIVDDVPSVYNDVAEVTFRLGMKDPALAASPSQANWITVNRYRVRFTRADGRNTPGVDIPYGFDGAMTVTVRDSSTMGFEIVRHTAKREAPLRALGFSGTIIQTIAEVTFYGRDQTGREVSVTASILVDFGNFADPE